MKTTIRLMFLIVAVLRFVSVGLAQRQDIGTKLLIPSSARTATFSSLLVVLNLDNQPNNVTITARRLNGSIIGTPIITTIAVGGQFRSEDILGDMGAGSGEFGPTTVESTNSRALSAISEVSSIQGAAGFFPGVNTSSAWTQGFIGEVVDSGDIGGAPGTHRTNLGVNTVSGSPANVTITFHNKSGTQLGSTTRSVDGNGMLQINHVIREVLGAQSVTGQNGYLKLISDQPIIAWASKIENASNDSSFQIGIAASNSNPIAKLDSNWDYFFDSTGDGLFGPLARPLGEVIYVQPPGQNALGVTFTLQGASPSTNYTVGIDIFGPAPCGSSPATFGVPRLVCADGTVGGVTASAGGYSVGTLTSDTNGNGSLHVNLPNLPSGSYSVLFWAVPCSPPSACGSIPQVSTGSWGVGPFEVITIP
jgi:hypothetical protein